MKDDTSDIRNAEREYAASQAQSVCNGLLGELWTNDEISDARTVWSCTCEGVSIPLSFSEVFDLEKRGLVKNLKLISSRGRYAGRYEFYATDKLEKLVKASYHPIIDHKTQKRRVVI
jgi:hypothetical protein